MVDWPCCRAGPILRAAGQLELTWVRWRKQEISKLSRCGGDGGGEGSYGGDWGSEYDQSTSYDILKEVIKHYKKNKN